MRRLFIALLLLAAPLLASPPIRVQSDPTFGTFSTDGPALDSISGWIWVSPGSVFGGSPSWPYPARVVAKGEGVLYLDPYPVLAGQFAVKITEDPLLFADGFERGLRAWPVAVGAVTPELSEAEARMAVESVPWFGVYVTSGLDSLGATVNVVFSESINGSTASTDTPASIFYRHVMRPIDWASWLAIRQKSGWPDIGGVIDHVEYHLVMDNTRNPTTHAGPLDDLQSLDFKDQAGTMYGVRKEWDAALRGWKPQDLADAQVLWKGTNLDGSFTGIGDSEFSLTVREQAKVDLALKASPVQYLGLGGGLEIENGGSPSAGARLIRLDASSLRGTGSQWFACGVLYYNIGFSGTEITLIDSPIFRLRGDPSGSPNVLKAQLRNAAGTWVTVGSSFSITHQDFKGILVNYDSTGPSADLWVNGSQVGTATTITGGIFAASSASTTFYNTPTSGTTPFQHFFFRHGSRLLADSEIPDRSQYSFDFASESNLDCALEFNERTGTIVSDMAGVQGAVLTGFSDPNAAWVSSGSGEPSGAKSYPKVFLGVPFLPAVDLVDVVFQIYAVGYYTSSPTSMRAVVGDGARLAATISASATSTDFNATTQQISVTDSEFNIEPAIGQTLTFSAGSNIGDHDVVQLLLDPRLLPGGLTRRWVANGSVIADETATSGNWSSAAGDWEDFFVALISGLSAYEVTGSAAERMSALLATGGATNKLAEDYLKNLGPVAGTVTTTGLAAVTSGGGGFGWQGDGGEDAEAQVDMLARVTPSSDYSPSVVYRNSSGTWNVTGSDLSPSSVVYLWGNRRIKSATAAAFPGKFDAVRVRYSRAWSTVPPGLISAASNVDALARECSIEWRHVTAGTGTKELVLDTFFLARSDAQSFADAIYSMLSGKLYSVELHGAILPAEAAMAPFTAVTVDWDGDTYLDGGANGIVVGLTVHPDKSATALVFFGS